MSGIGGGGGYVLVPGPYFDLESQESGNVWLIPAVDVVV